MNDFAEKLNESTEFNGIACLNRNHIIEVFEKCI